MPRVDSPYALPKEVVLGTRLTDRGVPHSEQIRQRAEVAEILERLKTQPGVILADEVGMGKTFVALAVAYSVAALSSRGPVVLMVPANLVEKWEQDLKTFCELYLDNRQPLRVEDASRKDLAAATTLRYGVARHSVELMGLLDDAPRERAKLIFLSSGAMTRAQSDKWVRLALIAEALRRHGRGKARRLIQVKRQIHRFLAELLRKLGDERANELGEDLWQHLLKTDPLAWRRIYNESAPPERRLMDDPVPKSVRRAINHLELRDLAGALEQMPVRAVGGTERVSERIQNARHALKDIERELWKQVLAQARWRSPLLVMDEAHHLKNPGTRLARQLQSADLDDDLSMGDGAMAGAFDRMLFLTATPFQLGHHELVRVLERFGDVDWNADELGDAAHFETKLTALRERLTDSQRAAIALQRAWSRLQSNDCEGEVNVWWQQLIAAPKEALPHRQRAVVDAFSTAMETRRQAENALRPWVIRHNKGTYWASTNVLRRQRMDGAAITETSTGTGLPIPPPQLLPFFLAARSVVKAGQELLGEALCSSFEAFRFTRQRRDAAKDTEDETSEQSVDLAHEGWYLSEFDRALSRSRGANHPKMAATVKKVVDLWERGEKVLVFAFYRYTCRALRIHISDEIERRLNAGAGRSIERVQKRFFDDVRSPGRRALDAELDKVLRAREDVLARTDLTPEQREELLDVMRRFLRVPATLLRSFPFDNYAELAPEESVRRLLAHTDHSGASWRDKFDAFIDFLARSSSAERQRYLEAAVRTETGTIRVEDDEDEESGGAGTKLTLANVQVATGKTKREARGRLMRAFNTPFFPDILVCSEVMGEGVDLQRFCRHVVHHDLSWNPSTIEQRTGRVDRLGCKAEGRHSIVVYLPYLAGTADERQYQVMSHREQWFRVVMGQDEVARLITPDSATAVPLPSQASDELAFRLGL